MGLLHAKTAIRRVAPSMIGLEPLNLFIESSFPQTARQRAEGCGPALLEYAKGREPGLDRRLLTQMQQLV
jgi:hypothetical protein